MDVIAVGMLLCAAAVVAVVVVITVRLGGRGLRGAAADEAGISDFGAATLDSDEPTAPGESLDLDPTQTDSPPPTVPASEAPPSTPPAPERDGDGDERPRRRRRGRRRRRSADVHVDWDSFADVLDEWTDELGSGSDSRDAPTNDAADDADADAAASADSGGAIRKVGDLEVGGTGWVLGVAAALDDDGQLHLRTDFNVYAVPTPLTTLRVTRTADGFTVEGTPLGTGRPGWERGPTVRAVAR